MPVIVMSGKPGCGLSTAAKLLAKKLRLRHFSVGDYNKAHAKAIKIETDRSIQMWKKESGFLKKFHIKSDEMARRIAKRGDVVIDAKLGIRMIKGLYDYSVWLTASGTVRAKRYAKRDNTSAATAAKKLAEKETLERTNWRRIYGFDYFDQEKEADLVINTSSKTPQQIVGEITGAMKKKQQEKRKIFQKIWNLALPYQDKRDDRGHAKTVLGYAIQLLRLEDADEEIVIPAAIMHDTGWSKMPKKERFAPVSGEMKNREGGPLRRKHEKLGAYLAGKILNRVKYNPAKTRKIVQIIDGHDTRKNVLSANDGIFRDADKLWRYSRTGFLADVRRRKIEPEEVYRMRLNQINLTGYFYSRSAKKIALQEIKKRKAEFKIA